MNRILTRLTLAVFCVVMLADQLATASPQAGGEKKPQESGKQPEKQEGHGAHEHHDMNAAGKDGSASMGAMGTVTGGPFRSMSAIGSGTSLLTASAPGYMLHSMKGNWTLMLHGEIKAGYNRQGGPRGISKAESQNWLMGMAERPAGPGRLMLRAMLSAEPWTTPRRGFPQLLQTGETFKGLPVIDAQHPHDLLMEIAASYSVALIEQLAIHFYGGPVAEPALGPTAFMHRPSASENPAPPLSHHYQDSSHITHGVITTGITAWRFRLEGSLFHGAEPDENRKDLEMGKLDSWSARLAFLPTKNWSMQYSQGHLVDPEFLDPGNLVRRTASISHNRSWQDGNWASTVVWAGIASFMATRTVICWNPQRTSGTRIISTPAWSSQTNPGFLKATSSDVPGV